jgi:DNA-binding GntR family transcriptional regulator
VTSSEHERSVASVDDIAKYVEAGQRWHTAVADTSHNELSAALMRARSDAVLSAADHARYDSLQARQATLRMHEVITRAIADQGASRTHDLMGSHVRAGARPSPGPLVDRDRRHLNLRTHR